MGAHWLFDLDDWLREDEIPFREWPGWLTRSRSTGGFDEVWGIVAHHTGSSSPWQNDCGYMWENAATRPIGNVHLDRAGIVTLGAAGASNTAGRGLADWHTSNGVIPVFPSSMGNRMTFNIEAANNGVGEQWPREQVYTYMRLNNLVGRKLHLDLARDLTTHRGWAGARKTDPYGPAQGYAELGRTYWSIPALRTLSLAAYAPPTPEPSPDHITSEDLMIVAKTTDGGHYASFGYRTGALHIGTRITEDGAFASGVALDASAGWPLRRVPHGSWAASAARVTKAQAFTILGNPI